LIWLGSGPQQIAFCFASDLDLLQTHVDNGQTSSRQGNPLPLAGTSIRLFAGGEGSGQGIMIEQGLHHNAPWQEVWQGRITNTTFLALRRGIAARFAPVPQPQADFQQDVRRRRHPPRRNPGRAHRFSLPATGTWQAIEIPQPLEDLIETQELLKDRVRILLDRYGIVFRDLLARERPEFRWPALFRTLRIMELSGEVVGGVFFNGISAPQFMSHQGLRLLQHESPTQAIYWINAADPVSLCGIVTEMASTCLPERRSSNHLVWHGSRIVVVSRQNAKKLVINTGPDDPNLTEYLGFMVNLLNRKFNPLRALKVEQINQQGAPGSPFIDVLRRLFDVAVDPAAVTLYRHQV
jgi:ATP-dependent Lhr-like helicase